MRKIRIDIARKPTTFIQCDERREIYSPSWELLMAYKNQEIDWQEYTARYLLEMRKMYQENSEVFKKDAKRLNNLDLICWCQNKNFPDEKCHRFLLKDILEKIREANNYNG